MLPETFKGIENLPMLRTAKEVRQTLGLTGYSHKFIPAY